MEKNRVDEKEAGKGNYEIKRSDEHNNGNNLRAVMRREGLDFTTREQPGREITPASYNIKSKGPLERNISFDDDFSKGRFHEIYIEGAHIFYSDFLVHKTRIIEAEILSPIIQMYFLLSGDNMVTHPGNKLISKITQNQNNIFLRSFSKGKYHLDGKKVANFGIQLTEKFFHRLIDGNCGHLEKIAEGIEKRKEYIQLSDHHMFITPQMKAVIHDIKNNPRTGHMKRLFLESKIIELFMLQVEQAEKTKNSTASGFRQEDIDRLYDAKLFLEQNMLNDFTLIELSRQIGLNDFKLKKGFKELFGTTVFNYLNELKMNYAKRLLLDEKKAVYEISTLLGYSEPHHFAAAFKRKFGYSPGELK